MLPLLLELCRLHEVSYSLVIERVMVPRGSIAANHLTSIDFVCHDLIPIDSSDIYRILVPVLRYATQHFFRRNVDVRQILAYLLFS